MIIEGTKNQLTVEDSDKDQVTFTKSEDGSLFVEIKDFIVKLENEEVEVLKDFLE